MKKINLKYWEKHISGLILPFLLLVVISSCSKMDEYKKYVEGGEISYTGKLDSVEALSGKDRILLKGVLKSDPKVKRCVIYWNNMADSAIIPITRTSSVDTLKFFINNISEGVQNFTIYTYDDAGNRSIPVYVTGRVYGSRYQATLTNRAINAAITNEAGITTIDWGGMDRLSGVFATDVIYQDLNDVEKTIRVPIDSNSLTLKNFKLKSTIKYRTLFLPDSVSVDTFYTSYTDRYIPKYIKTDVTSTYLVNTGPDVAYSSINSGNRWGILSGWTTSESIKNASGFGGYEKRSNVGFISLEAGWGLPNVTNGLIYQTVTLAPGSYVFEINSLDQNAGGTRYIAVAAGTTLPNVDNITLNSIAFATLDQKKITFTLSQATQVSIGFAANLTGTSSTGQYSKIGNVRLYMEEYL